MARVIALVGGGTMGPVVPLLALYKKLAERQPADSFVWVGTPDGPERKAIEELNIPFVPITVAKMPRYFSVKMLTWPFDYLDAAKDAKEFLDKWKPDVVIGAGGFSQVPVIRAAAKRGIVCAVHQLDFEPLLSNRLVARFCKLVTTSFVYHRKHLLVPIFRYSLQNRLTEEVTIATPNRFVGAIVPEKSKAAQYFGLDGSLPTVLFVGGGTGSRLLNEVVENNLDKWLAKVQILQITGKGRGFDAKERPGYAKREFIKQDEMLRAYAAADIVVSRGGMGAIADFAALLKPSIIVPIKNSAQEKNVRHMELSVVGVEESANLFEDLYHQICHLFAHPDERLRLAEEIHRALRTDDGTEWADHIEKLLPENENG
ncbi:MAG: glycosyltransferase [Patescibacteria group bacterium]